MQVETIMGNRVSAFYNPHNTKEVGVRPIFQRRLGGSQQEGNLLTVSQVASD